MEKLEMDDFDQALPDRLGIAVIMEKTPSSHPWADYRFDAIGVVARAADEDARQIERRLVRLEQRMSGEGAGELRRYQQDGLGWFTFLRRLGFGGCLADDMGLGKTVQAVAASLLLRERTGLPLSTMARVGAFVVRPPGRPTQPPARIC